MMCLFDFGAKRNWWTTAPNSECVQRPDLQRTCGISRHRFDDIIRALRLGDFTDEDARRDPWVRIDGFINAFNERRIRSITPGLPFQNHNGLTFSSGRTLLVDESMSLWLGADGKHQSHGMPHVTKIKRKPRGIGGELKNLADASSRIMLKLEIQKGKEFQRGRDLQVHTRWNRTNTSTHGSLPWFGPPGNSACFDSRINLAGLCWTKLVFRPIFDPRYGLVASVYYDHVSL